LDDIVITNFVAPAGEPMTLTVEEGTTATLTGLSANTAYEVRVKANCDAAEYCSPVVFTTADMETLTKDIVGYGNSAGGWHLIASPVVEAVTPTAENGFLTNEYDLYFFDQSQILEEWQNWKLNNFNLVSGKGYLYASQESTTLVFSGTPHPATDPVEVPLDYDGSVPDFAGWNLVGNPFAEPAFVDLDFYTMNSGGTEIIASTSTTVEAMEGIFVVAEGENESVTFTKADAGAKGANLALNISNGRAVIDRAIVRFDSHRSLLKFQLDPNSTKVYIPQDGKDYAVVSAGRDAARHVSTMGFTPSVHRQGPR
jgi:hypothetical protein